MPFIIVSASGSPSAIRARSSRIGCSSARTSCEKAIGWSTATVTTRPEGELKMRFSRARFARTMVFPLDEWTMR
jgi:hypothetical protein